MDSAAIKENARKRSDKQPALARQLAQRRNKKADGGIHAIDRDTAPSRTQEAAEAHEVDRGPVRRWNRASALPGLPDLPGYSLKWVRLHGSKHGDFGNLTRAIQEGWEPARKTEFAKVWLPTTTLSEFGSCLGNDNCILMKMPDELVAQRNQYYNDRRDKAAASVNQEAGLTQVQHPAMPLVQDLNKARVDFYRQRRKRRENAGGDAADED